MTNSEQNVFDMIVEIPKGSNIKYEWSEQHNQLVVDRVIQTPVNYFFNYGFIPGTLGLDSDPLDVVLLRCDPIYPLSRISIKVIGMLETCDEHGEDNKIIAVPANKVDVKSSCINHLEDLCHHDREQIRHFFLHYKDLEKGKWIKVRDFKSREETIKHILDSKVDK